MCERVKGVNTLRLDNFEWDALFMVTQTMFNTTKYTHKWRLERSHSSGETHSRFGFFSVCV